MLDSRRKSELLEVYKGKGDTRSIGNYRSVELLQYEIKVIDRTFEKRLRKTALLNEIQTGLSHKKVWHMHFSRCDRWWRNMRLPEESFTWWLWLLEEAFKEKSGELLEEKTLRKRK